MPRVLKRNLRIRVSGLGRGAGFGIKVHWYVTSTRFKVQDLGFRATRPVTHTFRLPSSKIHSPFVGVTSPSR